ncbi:uncharacterized protein LOC142636312 [Castanea sativa]|uniref:uncharacterized protein LOC142636312 n=1 Tax=Castanea sativa TaxID=21020 RepID=UPI003F650B56
MRMPEVMQTRCQILKQSTLSGRVSGKCMFLRRSSILNGDQLASNALPTKMNVVKRKILDDDICQLCAKKPESTLLALCECETIQLLWNKNFSWVDRRNKVHLNEAAQPLERIAEEACQYLKTYRNAHWRPPKGSGIPYKTNFDGAVFEDFGEASIGVVVQNYKAEVMASLSQTLQIQHR